MTTTTFIAGCTTKKFEKDLPLRRRDFLFG